MKVGLILGSFNPIHNGHIHLGEKVLSELDINEVWLTVSPQNPFKVNSDLEDENIRVEMAKLAIDDDRFKVCDIELSLDKPSYTYKTLRKLKETYPTYEFYIIMGSDVINRMNEWKKSDEVSEYPLITFVRSDEEIDFENAITEDITVLTSDIDLSSTIVRKRIRNNESLDGFIPNKVIKYINDNNLFK
ncbi:MAG: gp281 [uncultured marine phage]|uniref:Gp281 n=1 Tax=uncultured marine phage TaxID=707152 RepID=A0A8D9FRB1_9VIRU|nr:MAG: gp281 [uncultured marine phage]